MSEQPPLISICIVTYDSREEIDACLCAVKRNTTISHEILLWDNMPQDGTADLVRRQHPEVSVYSSGENIGYARANNALFRHARGSVLYLLNPDTEVESDTLEKITDYLANNPQVGIASTALRDDKGTALQPGAEEYSRQNYTAGELGILPGRWAFVIGASMVLRREVLEVTGGFDETFFLYAEDEDICLRARQNGWLVDIIGNAPVFHHQGASEKSTVPDFFWTRKIGAAWKFYRKHYSAVTRHRIARSAIWESRWRLIAVRLSGKTSTTQKTVRYRQELAHARVEEASRAAKRPPRHT
jgi:N-acetylglucosaminyl-diphospho-decaprenol L-rhamnosyltransferase